jgi:membrane dipeptidase
LADAATPAAVATGDAPVPVFDGHNDVLLKLHRAGGPRAARDFVTGREGHLDAPRARAGGFAGGFFAIYVPSDGDRDDSYDRMRQPEYDLPLPPPIPQPQALSVAMAQAATLLRLQALGALRIVTDAPTLRRCVETGVMAAVMHLEGAEAIDEDLHALDVLHAAGLRSLGPVWSRPTIFGHGVPFRYPADADIGPGLTQAGKALVDRCGELGIMLDLSHMNAAGFRDVAARSRKPLVATHSNAHALCPHARNLQDWQLEAIAASDGVVGLNFAVAFLREDGQMRADTPLTTMLRHLDHLIGTLGEDGVALGSDFDGAMVPDEIADVAGLPRLQAAMRQAGYGQALIEKLCWRNWARVLEQTWGPQEPA